MKTGMHPNSVSPMDISTPLHYAAEENIEENLERSLDDPIPYLNRRKAEKTMLDIVCSGNPLLLEEHIRDNILTVAQIPIGTMSREELTQQRYLCIVIIVLLCRAVIDAGVPEHISYSLSDSFIQEAERLRRPEELLEHSVNVMRTYCQAVRDYRMKNASPPVRKCCEYMLLKLHSNVTLHELSEVCHLSPNYISDLFRRELGLSALQFFHRQKLQYARHLILYSDWSIAKISAHLSYPSQSNFTQRFKKEYGVTPIQYRNDRW